MPWDITPRTLGEWERGGGKFTQRYMVQEVDGSSTFLLEDGRGGRILLQGSIAPSALLWHEVAKPVGDWNIQAGPV